MRVYSCLCRGCFSPVSVCQLVGLSAGLQNNYYTAFNRTWLDDGSWPRILYTPSFFGVDPDKGADPGIFSNLLHPCEIGIGRCTIFVHFLGNDAWIVVKQSGIVRCLPLNDERTILSYSFTNELVYLWKVPNRSF